VTAEIGRIFCPKCGNGGTLRKVAVTVNENGIVVAARRPRVTLRGTKVSSVCVYLRYRRYGDTIDIGQFSYVFQFASLFQ